MTEQGRLSPKGLAALGEDVALDARTRRDRKRPRSAGGEPPPEEAPHARGPSETRPSLIAASGPPAPGAAALSRPHGHRWGRSRAAAGALVPALALLALVVLHPSRPSDDRTVLVLAWLTVSLVVTVTGLTAYLAWRLDGGGGLAWASAGLVTLGLYGASGAVLALARVNLPQALPTPTLVDLAVLAAAAGCALGARALPWPGRDPLAVGVTTTAIGGLLRALVPTALVPAPGATGATVLALGVLGLAGLGGLGLLTGRLPRQMRWSLAITFALGAASGVVAGGQLGAVPDRAAGWTAAAGLAVATTAGMVSWRHLRELDRSRQRSLRSLALRARLGEAASEHNQDRMHELRATAAGVASASEVLAQEHADIPAARREALCELLVDETARLRRLTESFERGRVERVALDGVLGRVVGKQRALGQVVRWEPAQLDVEADGDMLREVVDILLVNAQVHAPGAWVRVSARPRQDKVVVRVRDTGPGVSPEVADRLFERGVRGRDSEGSGVGLHLARRLTEEMGGSLHHEPTQTGTCFVLTLVAHVEGVDHGAVAT